MYFSRLLLSSKAVKVIFGSYEVPKTQEGTKNVKESIYKATILEMGSIWFITC